MGIVNFKHSKIEVKSSHNQLVFSPHDPLGGGRKKNRETVRVGAERISGYPDSEKVCSDAAKSCSRSANSAVWSVGRRLIDHRRPSVEPDRNSTVRHPRGVLPTDQSVCLFVSFPPFLFIHPRIPFFSVFLFLLFLRSLSLSLSHCLRILVSLVAFLSSFSKLCFLDIDCV